MSDVNGSNQMPPLEIALGLLGGAVVVAMSTYLVVVGLAATDPGHPAVRIALDPVEAVSTGWVVPFRAINESQAPAQQVQLEATLTLPSGNEERHELVIDHLAPQSEQEGGFFFTTDPSQGRVHARAVSYIEP